MNEWVAARKGVHITVEGCHSSLVKHPTSSVALPDRLAIYLFSFCQLLGSLDVSRPALVSELNRILLSGRVALRGGGTFC